MRKFFRLQIMLEEFETFESHPSMIFRRLIIGCFKMQDSGVPRNDQAVLSDQGLESRLRALL